MEQLQRFQVYLALQLGVKDLANQTFGFDAEAARLERRANEPINHRTTVRHNEFSVAELGDLGRNSERNLR